MSERKCDWCKKDIPLDAVVCPNCQSWRKDINNEKIISYTLFGLSVVLLFLGIINTWWGNFLDTFRIGEFITSLSGWIVLGLFIAGMVYYVRVSKKIGTWWWYWEKNITRHFNSDSPPRRLLCAVIPLRSIIAQSKRRSGLPVKCGVRWTVENIGKALDSSVTLLWGFRSTWMVQWSQNTSPGGYWLRKCLGIFICHIECHVLCGEVFRPF